MSHSELQAIHAAAITAGLAEKRAGLLAGIDKKFVASLPILPSPGEQLLRDLHELSQAGTLVNGTVPLHTWLTNAVALAAGRRELGVIQDALHQHFLESAPPHSARGNVSRPDWKIRYIFATGALVGLIAGLILSRGYLSHIDKFKDSWFNAYVMLPIVLLTIPLFTARHTLKRYRAMISRPVPGSKQSAYRQRLFPEDKAASPDPFDVIIDDIRVSFQSMIIAIFAYWSGLLSISYEWGVVGIAGAFVLGASLAAGMYGLVGIVVTEYFRTRRI